MNTYKKFAANVFVAACEEKHERGETITLTTKYGKENEHEVFKFIKEVNGTFYHSILPRENYAERKAERIEAQQSRAIEKSNEYWERSNKDSAFLSMGEPIKVGHHSERRHRKIIEQAQNNMSKSCELMDKAESLDSRIEYWKAKAIEVNLSMPESVDYYADKLEEATAKHKDLKEHPEKREHSYSLTYANKEKKEAAKNLKLAKILWG